MNYLLVAAFGTAGSAARFGLGLAVPIAGFPFSTLIANVFGCFLLALIVYAFQSGVCRKPRLYDGICSGFLGGFTTFSAFGIENARMLLNGMYLTVMVYVMSSFVLGICATVLGMSLGKRLMVQEGER